MDIHKPKPWHGWREFLKESQALVIIKTNQEARVHRRVTMDLVGIKLRLPFKDALPAWRDKFANVGR